MMGGRATTAGWPDLARELDAWHAAGRCASLWWRDDDAAAATPALDALLAAGADIPLALAVIPGKAEASLARRLGTAPQVSVLQHGWMHVNHAPKGERAAELGAHRPLEVVLGELAAGWRALTGLLGRLALPVVTPPWNRITERLLPRLAEQGYRGLSTSGPRPAREASAGVVQVNAHVDLIDWKKARAFIGIPEALSRLCRHLEARRAGRVDLDEPSGVLTHHLVMERDSLDFLERLFAATRRHPGARWLTAAEAFALS